MPAGGATSAHRVDDTTKAALYEGLTIAQISRVYGITSAEASIRVGGIRPSGTRLGSPVYHLRDLAEVMWRPSEEDIDRAMARISHHQLPKTLTKEYWAGKRSKQEWQLRQGELWPTHRVIERASELVKLVRMNLQLMADTVDRQAELTEPQRRAINNIIDGTLRDLRRGMIEHFTPRQEADITEDDPVPADYVDDDEI